MTRRIRRTPAEDVDHARLIGFESDPAAGEAELDEGVVERVLSLDSDADVAVFDVKVRQRDFGRRGIERLVPEPQAVSVPVHPDVVDQGKTGLRPELTGIGSTAADR